MLPDDFSTRYPFVARGLVAMLEAVDERVNCDPESRGTVERELAAIETEAEPMLPLMKALFGETLPDDGAIIRFGIAGYHHLGVSDQVRRFVGSLWAALVGSWPKTKQIEFIYSLASGDQNQFQALTFAAEVFRRTPFEPTTISRWIVAAFRNIGHAERALQSAVDSYCRAFPDNAVVVAQELIESAPTPQLRPLIGGILAGLRLLPAPAEPVATGLREIDKQLEAKGSAEARVLFIESWARVSALPILDEAGALRIRDRLVTHDEPEEAAWCFLLASAMGDPSKAMWVHRELARLARGTLSGPAKKWTVIACLHGWTNSTSEAPVSRTDWERVIFAAVPFGVADAEVWDQLEGFLVDAFEKSPEAAHRFALRLAETSGPTWLARLAERDFVYLAQRLGQLGAQELLVSQFCFSDSGDARRLGLKFFEICRTAALRSELIATAEVSAIELILLEAAGQMIDPKTLARLHACLTKRVAEIGGGLADWYYDEIATQALNTNGYRVSLAELCKGDEYITALLADVHARLEETFRASQSPALQMQVPGRDRAESLAARRMAREVGKGVSKYSVLTQLVTTIGLLYGKKWRTTHADGGLSAASTLQHASVSMELPRMEFLAPESMHLRRLGLLTRIKEIEAQRGRTS